VIKAFAVVLVLAVAGVLGFAATRPGFFTVERTASIQAAPEKVFPLIEDFRRWREWSPYENLDPNMKRTLAGAEKGVGAVYSWDGDRKAGAGRMEITDAPSPVRVTIKLDFTRPFESSNMAEFRLVPKGAGTEVTWAMHGPNAFIGKLFGVFVDMDRMIGKDFEAGLASLKAIAEK
jgi:uncharacterized protein YndB with AHSA1/START domain